MNVSVIERPDSSLVADLHPSPNIEPRRPGFAPSIVILHYTGLLTVERALDVLSRPDCKVSCHYVIDEGGRIVQMVAEDKRAWHAGLSSWHGETDINSASIGIEIQNPGHMHGYPEFPDVQMRAVAALCRDLALRHDIAPERFLAHSDVAPGRKIDPGEKFDWPWLYGQGIGHWVPPAPFDADNIGPPLESGGRGLCSQPTDTRSIPTGPTTPTSGRSCGPSSFTSARRARTGAWTARPWTPFRGSSSPKAAKMAGLCD